jgi:hypothetical protein
MAKNTIIYTSHFELMSDLSDEQAGILIKSIGLFSNGEEPVITDPLIKGIFLAIKRDFVIQAENYEKKCNANRENGVKGGRPKKPTITETNPNNPMGFMETQHIPQNLKDKDKDKDKDKEIDNNKAIDNTVIAASSIAVSSNKKTFAEIFNENNGISARDYLSGKYT